MNQTPIPWPTLTAEEKKKVFSECLKIPPIDTRYGVFSKSLNRVGYFSGALNGLRSCDPRELWSIKEYADSAAELGRKTTDVKDAEVIEIPIYPPLTLDALFEIAKERNLDVSVEQHDGFGCYARVNKENGDPEEFCRSTEGVDSPQDALTIALLRHAGFEISTEQSTEGKM